MREPSRTKGPRLCPEQLQPPGPETPAQSGDPPLLPALAASPFCGQLGLLSAVCRLRSPDHHLSYWAALRTELSLGPGDRWHSQGVGFPGATVLSLSLWRLWGPCPLYLLRDTCRKCSPWALGLGLHTPPELTLCIGHILASSRASGFHPHPDCSS